MRRFLAVLAAVTFAGCGEREPAAKREPAMAEHPVDPAFWETWGDGQAEITSYRLTKPRYGEPREGTAITIFVTEPFSRSARVKADPGKHPASDEFPVMKLNLIRDYQTGIYEYSEMLSVFTGVKERRAVKATFGSREWCGHVFSQVLFDPRRVRYTMHSYFDGEEGSGTMEAPAEWLSEDELWHWARGMAGPRLADGESRSISMLLSLERVRGEHKQLSFQEATLARKGDTFSASIAGGPARQFHLDGAGRIVRWESTTGEKAELIAVERMKYWDLNQPEGEAALSRLKLRAASRL